MLLTLIANTLPQSLYRIALHRFLLPFEKYAESSPILALNNLENDYISQNLMKFYQIFSFES